MTEGLELLTAAGTWVLTFVPGGPAAIWAGILAAVGVGALGAAYRKFKAK